MATQQRERNGFNSLVDSAKDNAGDALKDTANKAGDKAKDTANRAGDIAKDTASRAGDLAKELADRAGDFVKDAASTVANSTTDAASYVAKKADDATVAVGENISSFAGTIREKGPRDGILGAADSAVADTVACVGKELEQGLGGMTDDLTQTIRRHPVPSVLIGIGVGFLIARAFTK